METNWRDHIASTPDVLRGKPRIKGTRIPVSLILGYLAGGSTFDDILSEFPDLTKVQIAACLDYTRANQMSPSIRHRSYPFSSSQR